MSGKSPSLLDDTFEILTIDPDGKKFDKGEHTPPHRPPSPPPPSPRLVVFVPSAAFPLIPLAWSLAS